MPGSWSRCLRLLSDGRSNAEIARNLFVEQSTVKTHLIHLYRKLNMSSRTQAIGRARTLRAAGLTIPRAKKLTVGRAPPFSPPSGGRGRRTPNPKLILESALGGVRRTIRRHLNRERIKTMTITLPAFTPLEESLFLTLCARALDNRSGQPILGDAMADEIVRTLDYDYEAMHISTDLHAQRHTPGEEAG